MSYNKQYNTRHSGRFNTPGQFVSAGEQMPQQQFPNVVQQRKAQPPPPPPPPAPPAPQPVEQKLQSPDVDMKPVVDQFNSSAPASGETTPRPHWMKSRLAGVKKISNKEKRRRQNETLRRLLTPKNALMVLNEMLPNEQVTNQFKVEPAANFNQYFNKSSQHSFCADLTIKGNNYKGYGENKLMARNVAAEQAFRDLIIEKMNKVFGTDNSSVGEDGPEEALPMIQLASFALHKLFTEWESEGHMVPQLRPTSHSVSESGSEAAGPPRPNVPGVPRVTKKKDLPANAASMHPCMLLTYMRPLLEYRELAIDGDRPQNMIFTLGVDVDGSTYIGKASNKKEARKQAAKAACQALFGVRFNENPTENAPQVVAPLTG